VPRAPTGGARALASGRELPSRSVTARRRQLVASLVLTAAGLGVYAHTQVGGAVSAGRALGVLTGDATALSPELVGPAAPGAAGAGPLGPNGPEAGVAGPEGSLVAPGDDGVVGTGDDVVVPFGGTRVPAGAGSPTDPGETTVTTRSTASTSTTLPPIPTDLAVNHVEVPATAPGSTDGCGKDVAFDATRMVDDQAETAWRMEGDGTGQTLTLSLGGSHRVVSVGMIPGYALVDPCDGTDRFAQNRRITKVTWQFDDGSAPVVQDLRDAAEMQRVAVSAQATTVTVRIDGVTAEPERDFTAISEIDVRGT
jgi:hypothetical protein